MEEKQKRGALERAVSMSYASLGKKWRLVENRKIATWKAIGIITFVAGMLSAFIWLASYRFEQGSITIGTKNLSFAKKDAPKDVVEGTLEVFHVDGTDGKGPDYRTEATEKKNSLYLYYLNDARGHKIQVTFAKNAPPLITGDKVRVRGTKHDDTLAADSGDSATLLAASPTVLTTSFGVKKTLVILVNFTDNITQPYTPATALGVMSTTSNFDKENSFNQTSLGGVKNTTQAADVTDWYTIPINSTVCDYSSIAAYAKQAATNAGYALSNYARYVYAFPKNSCSWWGLGTVGGNPAQSWINGAFALRVVGHEMGHNFGLYHSHSLACATGSCAQAEYGDGFDIMGGSSAHFSTFQKERLGWLNYNTSPPITTVVKSGSYTIAPYESNDTNSKALKILKSSSTNTYYYIEYRAGLGFDSGLTKSVIVHTALMADANSSNLWDLDQETTTSDWMLNPGQSYTDSVSGLTIAVVSQDASGATIQVAFGTPVCTHANPSMSISPSTQTGTAGKMLSYTVSVANNDTTGCSNENFNLTPSVPSGWNSSLSLNVINIAPGSSGSVVFSVTSPTVVPDSSYPVSVKAIDASDGSKTGSATASYNVSTAAVDTVVPTVSITNPANGSVVSGAMTTVTAEASDNVGVVKVEFLVDNVVKSTDQSVPYSYKWNIKKVSSGTHSIATKAYDAAGNSSSAQINVSK